MSLLSKVFDTVTANTVNTESLDTGRTWQNVTSSRSLDTQETNTTDSEIEVAVTINPTADGTRLGAFFNVDGGDVISTAAVKNSNNQTDLGPVKVSTGSTYEVETFGDTSNLELSKWEEFRP